MTEQQVRALRWTDRGLEVLDQRILPGTVAYSLCTTVSEVSECIALMQVRGAPAIGIAAAYGVVLAARQRFAESSSEWRDRIDGDFRRLASSRPTAVNLFWALERMHRHLDELPAGVDPVPSLLAEATKIHRSDVESNRAMGQLGAKFLAGSRGVLTHCNTGSLATGGHGTALGVIRSAHAGHPFPVFATETRPWSQGARLTIWELGQDQIPATLIADSSAACLMQQGKVDWVLVGADRIAANGDTANKIGTYALAVLARHHGVKFMVVAPMSTIDWQTQSGEAICIEERDPGELLHPAFLEQNSVIGAWNPVFDVTPASLIDVIVTEAGCVEQPSTVAMRTLRS